MNLQFSVVLYSSIGSFRLSNVKLIHSLKLFVRVVQLLHLGLVIV